MSHLLLIDDDDNFRKMLRTTLEDRGYEVTEACDGKEGLARHGARPADLVITDLIMPGKEGLETIIELRKLKPGLKIIAMSGGGRMSAKDYLPIARQLGAARVFAKPFANDALVAAINELLTEK
jgi:DNA-binding response OmpR family regulator